MWRILQDWRTLKADGFLNVAEAGILHFAAGRDSIYNHRQDRMLLLPLENTLK